MRICAGGWWSGVPALSYDRYVKIIFILLFFVLNFYVYI